MAWIEAFCIMCLLWSLAQALSRPDESSKAARIAAWQHAQESKRMQADQQRIITDMMRHKREMDLRRNFRH